MKSVIILSLICFISYVEGFCQIQKNSDTINRYDENGKKNGYWIELLKNDLKVTKDKKKAAYYWYVYYQNGERISSKLKLSDQLIFPSYLKINGNKSKDGEITVMNGTYSFFLRKGDVQMNELIFKDGFLLEISEFDSADTKVKVGSIYLNREDPLKYYILNYNNYGEVEIKTIFVFKKGRWHRFTEIPDNKHIRPED